MVDRCLGQSTRKQASIIKPSVFISSDGPNLKLASLGCPGNPPVSNGVRPENLRGHFQLHGGCAAAHAHVRAVVVTCPEPLCGLILYFLDNEEQHGSRLQAVMSISAKIGCAPHTMNDWVAKAEVDGGKPPGVPSENAEQMKVREREDRKLRRANDILRKASTFFAMAEFHRRSK